MEKLMPFIPQILQGLLFAIMLLMGMTLTLNDFKRISIYPRAVFLGLTSQLILVPLIGLLLITVFDLRPEFAVGLMVVAACPGGAVSNLFSHLSKGDTALSITLTACSSIFTLFTIPFIINWSIQYIMGAEGSEIQLPLIKTIVNIFKLTVLPVAIGIFIKEKLKSVSTFIEPTIAWVSTSIIIIALLLIYFKLDQIGDVWEFTKACFLAVLGLNILTLFVGFWFGRIAGLNIKQSVTTSIETGMQNNVMGMAIATSPVLLNNALYAVPAGIYGLMMCSAAILMIYIFRKMVVKAEIQNE